MEQSLAEWNRLKVRGWSPADTQGRGQKSMSVLRDKSRRRQRCELSLTGGI